MAKNEHHSPADEDIIREKCGMKKIIKVYKPYCKNNIKRIFFVPGVFHFTIFISFTTVMMAFPVHIILHLLWQLLSYLLALTFATNNQPPQRKKVLKLILLKFANSLFK